MHNTYKSRRSNVNCLAYIENTIARSTRIEREENLMLECQEGIEE